MSPCRNYAYVQKICNQYSDLPCAFFARCAIIRAAMATITPDQCRAARALVDISKGALAELSGVSIRAIDYFEAGERDPVPETLERLRRALEKKGVIFIDSNGGAGPGVRSRKLAKR